MTDDSTDTRYERDEEPTAPVHTQATPAQIDAAETAVAKACAALVGALKDYDRVQLVALERARVAQLAHAVIDDARAQRIRLAIDSGMGPADLARKLGLTPVVVTTAYALKRR